MWIQHLNCPAGHVICPVENEVCPNGHVVCLGKKETCSDSPVKCPDIFNASLQLSQVMWVQHVKGLTGQKIVLRFGEYARDRSNKLEFRDTFDFWFVCHCIFLFNCLS